MTIDGAPATIGQKADPESAVVRIDGIRLPVRPSAVYYLLYKPVGAISTRSDERGRQTVVDMVPSEPAVYPVGRLDADSEGLLILTNDGDLTFHLTHPSHGVTKTYTVLTTGRLTGSDAAALEKGVELDDGPARAVRARLIDHSRQGTLLELVMAEGRNRVVRRMIATRGEEVVRLVRTAIGPLTDGTLKSGSWRPLRPEEVRQLFATGDDTGLDVSWENAADMPATDTES